MPKRSASRPTFATSVTPERPLSRSVAARPTSVSSPTLFPWSNSGKWPSPVTSCRKSRPTSFPSCSAAWPSMRWSKTVFENLGRQCAFAAIVAATGSVHAAPQALPTPATQAPPTAVSQSAPASPRFVVLLDAAHGGDDPGGHLTNQAEKDFTLALSVRLRSLLSARGFQVITTRESDSAVVSDQRAETANHADAQACLSLHGSETGTGVHLFASSLAPSTSSRVPAWKTAQSAWITRSLALA